MKAGKLGALRAIVGVTSLFIELIDRKASLHRGTLRNAFTANTSLV
jgi:hypothetical protein